MSTIAKDGCEMAVLKQICLCETELFKFTTKMEHQVKTWQEH